MNNQQIGAQYIHGSPTNHGSIGHAHHQNSLTPSKSGKGANLGNPNLYNSPLGGLNNIQNIRIDNSSPGGGAQGNYIVGNNSNTPKEAYKRNLVGLSNKKHGNARDYS